MTAIEAYKRFLIKLNKNDTNSNIAVNKGQFVLIFNEQADIWLDRKIDEDLRNSEKNELETLLIHEAPLTKVRDTITYSEFELPDDYFDYENSYSIATRGDCTNRKLLNWDFKARNKSTIDQDENHNPSFDFEETIVNVSQNSLLVFKTDFEINQQFLTYYRQPKHIDLAGYKKFDGTDSTNIDPELLDIYVSEILNMCVIEVDTNYGNTEQFQIDRTKKQ